MTRILLSAALFSTLLLCVPGSSFGQSDTLNLASEDVRSIDGRWEIKALSFDGKAVPRAPGVVQTYIFAPKAKLVIETIVKGKRSTQEGRWSVKGDLLTTKLTSPMNGKTLQDTLRFSFKGKDLVLTKADSTVLTLSFKNTR